MLKTQVLLFFLTMAFYAQGQTALPEPPVQYEAVVDRAELLSAPAETELRAQLQDYEQKTSNQFVVLTLKSLQGRSIEELSARIAESWGIGQKGKDNGLLLLVAEAERKVRIEVGYGLEASITDVQAKAIIENQLLPSFKTGDYEKGIAAGIASLIKVARGDFERGPTGPMLPYWLLVLVAFGSLGLALDPILHIWSSYEDRRFKKMSRALLLSFCSLWAVACYGLYHWNGGQLDWAMALSFWILPVLLIGIADFRRRREAKRIWLERFGRKWRAIEHWSEDQQLYRNSDVKAKLPELQDRLLAMDATQKGRRAALIQASRILSAPHHYFETRIDADLQRMEEAIQNCLDSWAEVHADWLQFNWEQSLKRWSALADSELTDKQSEELTADLNFFREKIDAHFQSTYQAAWTYLKSEEPLESLLNRYYPESRIRSTWQAKRERFLRPETVESRPDLKAAVVEVVALFEEAAQHFEERNDYALRQWANNERIDRLLGTNWYRADRRAALQRELESALAYFGGLSTEKLNEEDEAERQRVLTDLQELHNNPKSKLGYDSSALEKEIEALWEDERWASIAEKFTAESISRKQKALKKEEQKAKASTSSEKGELLIALIGSLTALLAHPEDKLETPYQVLRKKRKRLKERSSKSRSFGSRAWSSSSSKSRLGSSDSDWGGGDFGGGGASGDW